MKITKHEQIPEQELLARLKRTRLKGHGQPEIYKNSTLDLVERIDPESLVPAQRYVLKEDLQNIVELYDAFAARGIDIFSLRGGILFWREEEGAIPLIPPVIEESIEPGGGKVLLINDGMHRVYAARKLGRRINVIVARDVPVQFPYYAYALANGWAEVAEVVELTPGFQKKSYRDEANYKALFRDFNEVLPGIQKQRKRT